VGIVGIGRDEKATTDDQRKVGRALGNFCPPHPIWNDEVVVDDLAAT
jgi:hypothetical protein